MYLHVRFEGRLNARQKWVRNAAGEKHPHPSDLHHCPGDPVGCLLFALRFPTVEGRSEAQTRAAACWQAPWRPTERGGVAMVASWRKDVVCTRIGEEDPGCGSGRMPRGSALRRHVASPLKLHPTSMPSRHGDTSEHGQVLLETGCGDLPSILPKAPRLIIREEAYFRES